METKSPGEESDYGGSTEDDQEAEPRPPDPKPPTHGYYSPRNYNSVIMSFQTFFPNASAKQIQSIYCS